MCVYVCACWGRVSILGWGTCVCQGLEVALSVAQGRTGNMLPRAECEEGLLRGKGGLAEMLMSELPEHTCSSVTHAGMALRQKTPGSTEE